MPKNHSAHVPAHGVQPNLNAEPIQPRNAARSRDGGAPILGPRRNQLLQRPPLLPLLHVHARVRSELPEADPRLQVRLHSSSNRLREVHEKVRLRLARAHELRPLPRVRLGQRSLHGPHGRLQRTKKHTAQHQPQHKQRRQAQVQVEPEKARSRRAQSQPHRNSERGRAARPRGSQQTRLGLFTRQTVHVSVHSTSAEPIRRPIQQDLNGRPRQLHSAVPKLVFQPIGADVRLLLAAHVVNVVSSELFDHGADLFDPIQPI